MGSALEALRERTLMSAPQIDRIIARLAHQILEPEDAQQGLVLIGIRRGGEQLARRLSSKIESISGMKPAIGFLNINLYRDDDVAKSLPESDIAEDLSGKVVIVVDDVLLYGPNRSIGTRRRDGSRTSASRSGFAVLVDRGLRELPVQGRLRRPHDSDEPARTHRGAASVEDVRGRRSRRHSQRSPMTGA